MIKVREQFYQLLPYPPEHPCKIRSKQPAQLLARRQQLATPTRPSRTINKSPKRQLFSVALREPFMHLTGPKARIQSFPFRGTVRQMIPGKSDRWLATESQQAKLHLRSATTSFPCASTQVCADAPEPAALSRSLNAPCLSLSAKITDGSDFSLSSNHRSVHWSAIEKCRSFSLRNHNV